MSKYRNDYYEDMNGDILLTIHIVSCIEEKQKIPDEKGTRSKLTEG